MFACSIRRAARRAWFPLLGVFALSCATTQRLVVPSDVSSACKPLEVKNRSRWGSFSSESFKLGAYSIGGVDRGASEAENEKSGSISHAAESSDGSYVLEDGKAKLEGKCETHSRSDKAVIAKPFTLKSESAAVSCSCRGDEAPARVVLTGKIGKLAGTLQTSAGSYTVTSLYEVDVGAEPGGPTGYRVDGDRPVGAVDVLYPGGAWLDPKLEEAERRELACLFAGLILYRAHTPD